MRPTHNLRCSSSKGLISSSYINHESIDIALKYPVFNKILNANDVKLLDIANLQVETEKIMCLLGYRMMNLSSFIEGKPMVLLNGISSDSSKTFFSLNNHSASLSSSLLSSDLMEQQYGNKINNSSDVNNKSNDLNQKSSPEKSMSFTISQNRPSTRRTSGVIKRKLTKDDLMSLNSSIKRKKPNDFIQDSSNEEKVTPATQNYEIPNKFWELMEPYCAEINDDHIKTLDNLIKSYENDVIYYEVPDISTRNDSASENQSIGVNLRRNMVNDDVNHLNGFVDGKNGVDLSNLLKKIDIEIRRPLSQTKALDEFPRKLVDTVSKETEDFIHHHQMKVKESKTNGFANKNVQSSKSIAKQLKVSNSFKLERHIKKTVDDLGMCNFNLPFIGKLNPAHDWHSESEQQHGIAKSDEADIIDPGVLNSHDYVELSLPQPSATSPPPSPSPLPTRKRKLDFTKCKEDKALLGLTRRQAELKLVSESNLGMLRRLMVAAKRDLKRQEIERRLAVADADVIECYNIIESYRPTHKIPLRKDRDAAYKALKERKKILKELDSLDIEFL